MQGKCLAWLGNLLLFLQSKPSGTEMDLQNAPLLKSYSFHLGKRQLQNDEFLLTLITLETTFLHNENTGVSYFSPTAVKNTG